MELDPFFGDAMEPDIGDYPVGGRMTGAMARALKNAKDKGWLENENEGAGQDDASAYKRLQRALGKNSRTATRPGTGGGAAFQAADRYYRALIEKHIEAMPKRLKERKPELIIPSVLEDWQTGDEIQDINWMESISRGGENAAVHLVRRDLIADDPAQELDKDHPEIEIYLDTSGSMPSPDVDTNMMTLAALVLAVYAIRRGGRVRGVIYSAGPFLQSEWMMSEDVARRFFLQYVGGGTSFPFGELVRSANLNPKAYRIVISDSDFLWNVDDPEARLQFEAGILRSKLLVTVLSDVEEKALAQHAGAGTLAHANFRHVEVKDLKDFANVTSELARALLGES